MLLRGKECPDSNKANVKNENLGKDGGKGGNAPEVTAKMGTLFITGNVTVTAKGGQGGGLEHAAKTALQNSGRFIPWQVVTVSTDGRIPEE